jgi:ATP-binding cassette subfamily B protein RtxE
MSWVTNNEWLQATRDERIDWRALARFLEHYRPFRLQLAGAIGLTFLASLLTFAIIPLFAAVQVAIGANDRALLALAMAGYGAIMLLDVVGRYLVRLVRTRVSTLLDQELLTRYYRQILNISVEDFLAFQRKTNLYQRVVDAMATTGHFTDIIIQSAQSLALIAVILIVVGTISMTILGILLAGSGLLFLFVFSEAARVRALHTRTLAVNYPLVAKMLEVIDGLFTIKALAGTVQVTDDIARLVGARKDAEYREHLADARAAHGALAIRTVSLVLAWATGFALLMKGAIDYSQAFALYVLANGLFGPVVDLGRLYQNLSTLSVNVRRYYQVLDIPDESVSLAPTVSVAVQERPAPAIGGHIRLCGVECGYRNGDAVLQDLDLEIHPGERISLIGKSGAGKTTLMRLLIGFLQPWRGTVCVDGVNIASLADKGAYRQRFGVVGQHDFLFDISIRDNMLFGLDRRFDDGEIAEVLKCVGLWDEVRAWPDQLDTRCSRERFSGGQRQRLFIARALLRQPHIILLDEPTSALDFESEARVLAALDTLVRRRTTITIAHRLSTVKHADRVIVLDKKRIIASGPHQELTDTNEYYRSLCRFNSFIV